MIESKPDLQELGVFIQDDLESPSARIPLLDFIEPENKGNLGAETLTKQFELVVDTLTKSALQQWRTTFEQRLEEYVGYIDTFSDVARQTEDKTKSIAELRQALTVLLKGIYTWTDTLPREFAIVDLWTNLQTQFASELKMVPDSATIPISDDFWQAANGESIRTKLLKRKTQARLALKNSVSSLQHKIGQDTEAGLSTNGARAAYRTFDLHAFLKYHLEFPIAEILYTEWLRFTQKVASQLYLLHMTTVQIKDDFRFLNDFDIVISQVDEDALSVAIEKLTHRIKTFSSFTEQFTQFEVDALKRIRQREAEIYEQVRQRWHEAGTDMLPDASFGQAKIAKQWKQLETTLIRGQEHWLNHLQAEKGEWQAGLELSLLQLETVQVYLETKAATSNIIHSQIIPAYSSTLETVASFHRSISSMDFSTASPVSEDVIEENRQILSTLQQEQMPLMMDTLIKVQLDNVNKGYALRVRNAVETLSEHHIIFLNRDFDNVVPKSETDDTHFLKAIVLEQIFSKFAKDHKIFNVDYQHTVEQMIRTISEIDRVVENDIDQTFAEFERRTNQAGLETTRKTVIDELNQISRQINDLVVQTKHLASDSDRKLLDITRTFENQLLELADTDAETKVEKYLLLAQATARERLRNYRRKMISSVKTAPPSVGTVVTDTVQRVQTNIFRLREMTGFAQSKDNAEENLTRFLTDTEDHINALPYVYQRLFRLAPLSDDRFFTARNTELTQLSEEFERWETGKFTATALIGERGSGISTLLNFAKQKIYKDYPITMLDFLDSDAIFTDEALFEFLKPAFRVEDLQGDPKNLNDLEDKIIAMDTRKVFIIENLQHLFIRTVYGFDALERFMLFISRTHHKIHWIMTCALYSWEYFTKVINIDEYVQRKIVFQALPQSEIEEIILRRHRASGYQLLFEPSEDIIQSRRYRRLKTEQDRQAFLQDLFFEQLAALATGNVAVAMLFWLRSYKAFSEDKLILPATINFNPSFLYRLPSEELFTLAALLQHDILNTEDHSLIFHQGLQQSQLLLGRMANKGFLVESPHGYYIHPFLYRPVVQVLKSDNIIH